MYSLVRFETSSKYPAGQTAPAIYMILVFPQRIAVLPCILRKGNTIWHDLADADDFMLHGGHAISLAAAHAVKELFPMSLQEQIEKDFVTAYKARENVRVSVLRMLKTAVKRRLVDTSRPGEQLCDDEMTDVIIKEAKQRRDSIAEYEKAGRADLAARERDELTVLEGYLPSALTDEELEKAVDDMIATTGAQGPADMGRVMGPLMKALKGRVDGARLSAMVKARLTHQGLA